MVGGCFAPRRDEVECFKWFGGFVLLLVGVVDEVCFNRRGDENFQTFSSD